MAHHNILNNFATQIATNIHHTLEGPSTRRQSAPRTYIDRKREFYNELLIADYFCDNPTYPDYYFRRRFHMGKPLFLRIVQALGEWSPYFTQRVDALGRPGLSPLQKCTVAMHMLAYGVPTDKTDDHIRLGASTALESLEKFAKGVIAKFGGEYLRRPTVEDIQRLLEIGEARGFPGMLGSIDYMHWEWKNCPVGWKGPFTCGDYGVPTIILEVLLFIYLSCNLSHSFTPNFSNLHSGGTTGRASSAGTEHVDLELDHVTLPVTLGMALPWSSLLHQALRWLPLLAPMVGYSAHDCEHKPYKTFDNQTSSMKCPPTMDTSLHRLLPFFASPFFFANKGICVITYKARVFW